ncbi:MAG: helix-hairpin-helix domain-containing protein [Paludibacter sp.]
MLSCSYSLRAQDAATTTEQLIADIFEQYAAESDDAIDYDSFFEDLMFCAQNPINLNRATREQLDKLPFLSDMQVENILSYVYESGGMQTIYELQLVDGLDMTDIRRMLPFVNVGEAIDQTKKIYWRDLLKYGKNELLFRLDKGLETKEGYQFLPEEDPNSVETNSKNYLGNSIYQSLRYKFHFKDRIQFGFTGEKDAGEQFWGTVHKGYDFYSVHVQLNDFGKFKTIVAGDFRANFRAGFGASSRVWHGQIVVCVECNSTQFRIEEIQFYR